MGYEMACFSFFIYFCLLNNNMVECFFYIETLETLEEKDVPFSALDRVLSLYASLSSSN